MSEWVESNLTKILAREDVARLNASGVRLIVAEVMRPGARTATETTEYWDCVIPTDLNANHEINSTDRPVYGLMANVIAPVGIEVGEGDAVIVVAGNQPLTRNVSTPGWEYGSGYDYDVTRVNTGGLIISSSGASALTWGYFQGARDLGFAGMTVS